MRAKLLALAVITLLGASFISAPTAQAADASNFKAGRIIDDGVMYDNTSMTANEIQNFIRNRLADVGACQPNHADSTTNWRDMGPLYVCLKDYVENPNVPIRNCTQDEVQAHFGFGPSDSRYSTALNYCWWKDGRANIKGQSVSNGSAQSAGTIIWQAAQDYHINPKVLLVMLQKEQSLLTDTFPWVGQFQKAMGYACPDTGACDPSYRGFYNQVRSAASQLRRYANHPDEYNYVAGTTNNIKYHPNAACGTKSVFIENQATASLYNYTPYTPNQAALNNLYGTGDSCSSYGNRNFWRMFSDWFGAPNINFSQDQVLVGDWDGNGHDTVGIKRGSTYYLDNNNDGLADWTFGFGNPTDVPLVGDWDGDGSDEIGLRRGDRFYYSTDFNGSAEIYQAFGNSTDKVLIGDWNGDDRDSVALKRGDRFYIDNNYDGQAEAYMGFGDPSDAGIAGDWNGNGVTDIGLRRGDHYFLNYGFDGHAELSFGYGSVGYKTLIGDWNDDGKDSIGLKNGQYYYFSNDNDGQTDIYSGFGNKSDQTIIGDWDGNGSDTIGIKRGNYIYLDNNFDGQAETIYYYTF